MDIPTKRGPIVNTRLANLNLTQLSRESATDFVRRMQQQKAQEQAAAEPRSQMPLYLMVGGGLLVAALILRK